MNNVLIDETRKKHPFLIPLDIPLGKVLKPVIDDSSAGCVGCYFSKKGKGDCWTGLLKCDSHDRKDKKRIIWKVVKG